MVIANESRTIPHCHVAIRQFGTRGDHMSQWNKYGPTAARAHGRPGRELRPQSITIDVHSHVGVPRAAEFVKPHLAPDAMPLVTFADTPTRALNQKQEVDIVARASLEQRLADMDAMGLDMQVVLPPPPQCYYAVPPDIAVKAAQLVNDGIAEFVARRPDRLKGFGSVPMPDGNEAASELERCVTKLGFKGVQILTNVNGAELSDPAFAPFWRKAEELGALVVIHPNGFTHAAAPVALLLQQHHRQPAGDHHRVALPDFRRCARAPPEPENPRRSRRRLSRQLCGTHRPRLGSTFGREGRLATSAHDVLEEGVFRHGGIHAPPAAGARAPLRRRAHLDGDRLPLRHGRLRSRRSRLRIGAGCGGGRSDLRRQHPAVARAVAERARLRSCDTAIPTAISRLAPTTQVSLRPA